MWQLDITMKWENAGRRMNWIDIFDAYPFPKLVDYEKRQRLDQLQWFPSWAIRDERSRGWGNGFPIIDTNDIIADTLRHCSEEETLNIILTKWLELCLSQHVTGGGGRQSWKFSSFPPHKANVRRPLISFIFGNLGEICVGGCRSGGECVIMINYWIL